MILRTFLQLGLFALLLAGQHAAIAGNLRAHIQHTLHTQAVMDGGATDAVAIKPSHPSALAIDVLAHLEYTLMLEARSPLEGGGSVHADAYLPAIVHQLIKEHQPHSPWNSDDSNPVTVSFDHPSNADFDHALMAEFSFHALAKERVQYRQHHETLLARLTVTPYFSRAPPVRLS